MQAIVSTGLLILWLSVLSSANAEELKKIGFSDAASIGLQINTDTTVKTAGPGSVKITTIWPTTIPLAEVTGLDVEEAKLVFTAQVKTALEGNAYLEMWAFVGGGQYFSRGLNDTVTGTSDWKTIRTPFLFQKGQKPDKLILNLVVNGKGTVWIDDVTLVKEPLK